MNSHETTATKNQLEVLAKHLEEKIERLITFLHSNESNFTTHHGSTLGGTRKMDKQASGKLYSHFTDSPDRSPGHYPSIKSVYKKTFFYRLYDITGVEKTGKLRPNDPGYINYHNISASVHINLNILEDGDYTLMVEFPYPYSEMGIKSLSLAPRDGTNWIDICKPDGYYIMSDEEKAKKLKEIDIYLTTLFESAGILGGWKENLKKRAFDIKGLFKF